MEDTKRLLCVPDAHVPYHDERAMNLVLQVAAKWKPDIIIVMGDWWDCWQVSDHEKTLAKRRMQFDDEILAGEKLLSQFEAPQKFFLEGNHEFRLARYMARKAPELGGLLERKQVSIRAFVETLGWKFTPYRRSLKLGKVYYTHDFDRAGRYAVHQNLSDTQHSFVIGHTHRFDYAVEGDSIGGSRLGASFGWLGDFDTVDYRSYLRAAREWTHGFGVGYMLKSGLTLWQPVPIVNNLCVVEGKVYR